MSIKVVIIEEQRELMGNFSTKDLLKDKEYDAIIDDGKHHWYRIIDESGEDYIYPPELFKIIREEKNMKKPAPSILEDEKSNFRQCLLDSVKAIKDYLIEEKNESTKLGLFMALNTIKNRVTIYNEELLEELDLDEDFEKYL